MLCVWYVGKKVVQKLSGGGCGNNVKNRVGIKGQGMGHGKVPGRHIGYGKGKVGEGVKGNTRQQGT